MTRAVTRRAKFFAATHPGGRDPGIPTESLAWNAVYSRCTARRSTLRGGGTPGTGGRSNGAHGRSMDGMGERPAVDRGPLTEPGNVVI